MGSEENSRWNGGASLGQAGPRDKGGVPGPDSSLLLYLMNPDDGLILAPLHCTRSAALLGSERGLRGSARSLLGNFGTISIPLCCGGKVSSDAQPKFGIPGFVGTIGLTSPDSATADSGYELGVC